MKIIKLTAAATVAAVLAAPVLAQDAVLAPAVPAPGAMEAFAPPEGYAALADWSGLTADVLTGADVTGPDGSSIGSVTDVVLAADGSAGALVADIGGFLGIGTHTVQLGAEHVTLYRNADGAIIAHSAMTKDQLEALPEYTPPG